MSSDEPTVTAFELPDEDRSAWPPATEKDLVQMIEYLEAENKILRSKLPKRVEVTPAEKTTLTKLGVRLGSAIKELITIVHPRTSPAGLPTPRQAPRRRRPGAAPGSRRRLANW